LAVHIIERDSKKLIYFYAYCKKKFTFITHINSVKKKQEL